MKSAKMKRITEQVKQQKEIIHKAVQSSMKHAASCCLRTKTSRDGLSHQMPVCAVCDTFIIGTERIHNMSVKRLKSHECALGVKSYEEFYNVCLPKDLKRYYRLPGLNGLLLSPRTRKNQRGYTICSTCHSWLSNQKPGHNRPPPLSIANGFVIGTFPHKIQISSGKHKGKSRTIDIEDDNQVSDVMRAMLAPVRPYGYVLAYTGGVHQKIKGHYQFFEMDTGKINAGMNAISQENNNIYVLCFVEQ